MWTSLFFYTLKGVKFLMEQIETGGKKRSKVLAVSLRVLAVIVVIALGAVAGRITYIYSQNLDYVATVNGERITKNQLYTAMSEMADNMGNTVEELALDDLIRRLVVEQKAKELGVKVSEEEIDQEVQEYVDLYFEGDMDEFINELDWHGVSLEDIRSDFSLNLTAKKIAEHGDFEVLEEVEVRHILVDTEQEALDVLTQLDSGRDFGELAEDYSQCPSRDRGGMLDPFGPGQMAKEFEEASFSASVGDIVGPVETSHGFHVIEVLDRIEGEYDVPAVVNKLKEEADISYR